MTPDEKFSMVIITLARILDAIARHDLDEARRLFASVQTWWAISTVLSEDLTTIAQALITLERDYTEAIKNGGNTPTDIESASQSSGEWHGEGDRSLSNDDGGVSGIH